MKLETQRNTKRRNQTKRKSGKMWGTPGLSLLFAVSVSLLKPQPSVCCILHFFSPWAFLNLHVILSIWKYVLWVHVKYIHFKFQRVCCFLCGVRGLEWPSEGWVWLVTSQSPFGEFCQQQPLAGVRVTWTPSHNPGAPVVVVFLVF